jgi:diguanylate cyclase (GGDEF)-like protein
MPPVSRRAGLQLLLGVLIVGAIPVVSTARILEANALRNERAHADAALRGELQNGLRELGRISDDASSRADDLARSPVVQRAMFAGDRAPLERLAANRPDTTFFLGRTRVGSPAEDVALERSVSLTADGSRIGKVVVTVRLDQRLAARLTKNAPHGAADRLVLARSGQILGTSKHVTTEGSTVHAGGESYRAMPALVPDATKGVRLLALRPETKIHENVAPYQQRIRYAALGSFALLTLVALLFAGPMLRLLGDFRRVASQASTDGLTGLANRRMLDEELVLEWRRADRIGEPLGFVLLDLDNFKGVNDTHGHQAGDAVLRAVGELLASGMRQVDLAGRYGGEEFALILPGTDFAGAQKLAERLRAALESRLIELPEGATLTATASFGVAAKDELASPEKLIAAADEALYEAKRAGKNRIVPELVAAPAVEPAEPERRAPKPPAKRSAKAAAPKKAPAKKTAKAKAPAAKRKPSPRRPVEGET